MSLNTELQAKGWYLSDEGIDECKGGVDRVTAAAVIEKALDTDLRDIGGNFLTDEIQRGKVDSFSGPCVLQIQKVKNASAPKYEYFTGAPPLLRLLLTDGLLNVNAVQWGNWKSVNQDTPPGTKIFIKPGKVTVQNGFLLLGENNFSVLGGCVEALVHKWEVSRSLASHVRTVEATDGGPPPWIPFGKIINLGDTKNLGGNFRSLERETKEQKENSAFKEQRLANIAEVSRAKEGKVKVFGGGKDKVASTNSNNNNGNNYNNKSGIELQHTPNNMDNRKSNFQRGQKSVNDSYSGSFSRLMHIPQKFPVEGRNTFQMDKEVFRNSSYKAEDSCNKHSDLDKIDKKRDSYGNRGGNDSGLYRQKGPNQSRNSTDYPSKTQGKCVSNHRNGHYSPNVRLSNSTNDSLGDSEELIHKTSQPKLHNSGNKNEGYIQNSSEKSFLRPGAEVLAKYWEDNKFYRAIVHAVGENGATCVVHFVDYGNYEEVMIADVLPNLTNSASRPPLLNHWSQWNGPQKSAVNQGGLDHFTGVLEFRRGGNKPFVHHRNGRESANDMNQERQKERGNARPSVKLYQPPPQRRQS